KEEKKPLYEEIAVTLEAPRHHPQGTVVLRGGRVITMHGDDVIADADIVVKDNRITAVGQRGSVSVPEGAKVFDLNGTTIMPGLFADTDFQSLDDVKSVVSRYKKYYRTNSLKSYMIGNRQQRQWMVESCKDIGVMPTTEGGINTKLDLTHAIDGFAGNEHSLP